ncbi:MAG: hypothetical protein ACOH1J_04315 [Microbacteriaceae bacterium]
MNNSQNVIHDDTVGESSSLLGPRHHIAILTRATMAALAATVITFSADHSPALGIAVFGAFALATGLVIAIAALTTISSGSTRSLIIVQGIVGVATGISALVVSDRDLGTLILFVAVFASITGFIELFVGLRTRGKVAVSRDWIFIGALTAALAVAAVLLPRDIRDPVVGVNGLETYLTSSVVLVGVFGAYCAVVAVYLAIAGLSLPGAHRPTAVVAADGVE